MARYRQIDQRIWNDEKFFSLSNDGKLLFFYLLTCPAMTMLGAAPIRAEAVAVDLGWDSKRYAIPYRELYERGMAEYDDRGLFWVKNFLKYNPPANPKVVIGYSSLLDSLPECPLLSKVIQNLGKLCESKGGEYAKVYVKSFPEPLRNGTRYGMPYGMADRMPNQRTENREQEIYKPPVDPPSTSQAEEGEPKADDSDSSLFESEAESESAEKPKPERKPRQPLVYIPDKLPDEWRKAALTIRPDVNPEFVFNKVRARFSGTSNKKTLGNWRKIFLDWIGREYARNGNGNQNSANGASGKPRSHSGPSWEPKPGLDYTRGINPDFTINKKECGLW